jgi:hypothetical protein
MTHNIGDRANFVQQLHDYAARLRQKGAPANAGDAKQIAEEAAVLLDKAANVIDLYRTAFSPTERLRYEEAEVETKVESTYPPRARHTGFSDR